MTPPETSVVLCACEHRLAVNCQEDDCCDAGNDPFTAPTFTPEEIEALMHVSSEGHGSRTACPRNFRQMCPHWPAAQSARAKLEATRDGTL